MVLSGQLNTALRRAEEILASTKKNELADREKICGYQKRIRALKMQCVRAAERVRAISKERAYAPTTAIIRRRAFSPQVRAFARIMVRSGCAQAKVGQLVRQAGRLFGIDVGRVPSRRTVGRNCLEGGVVNDIQMGFKMGQTEALTISADSTSHHRVNIESRLVAMRTPSYASPSTGPDRTLKVRTLGVFSTVDHSSNASVSGWQQRLRGIEDVFSRSPLAKHTTIHFSLRDFAKKLRGMNGDHATVEKCTAAAMEQWKRAEVMAELGETVCLEKDLAELGAIMREWTAKKIEDAGGITAWTALSPEEQAVRDVAMMQALVTSLGKEALEKLPAEDRQNLTLFIWCGCCMHKDQNSFKGGNIEMMAAWAKHNLVPPIMLANKANAAIVQRVLTPEKSNQPITDTELAALEALTFGGAKTTALAGAIFSNKDDKKGQGDMHVDYFALITGTSRRFPQTNNTRFGSHGEAAEVLLEHLDAYIAFLHLIRDKKKQPGWTNIESNVYKALHDVPTLTELAIMVLYTNAITHPYMRAVRGQGTNATNALDLGPLHRRVCEHIQRIIEDPDLLLGPSASFCEGSLDGLEWENKASMDAVFRLQPRLPNIKILLVGFLKGALPTWVRFSAEFAPDGLIDTASATEKELAWMPSTNDANEGALGSYRVYLRNRPRTTQERYNALTTFHQNEGQAFMDATFADVDHTFVMREARARDTSGLEAARRKELVEHNKMVAEETERKREEKRQIRRTLLERLGKVELSNVKTKPKKLAALQDALTRLLAKGDPEILKVAALEARLKALDAEVEAEGVLVQDWEEQADAEDDDV
ncbi:hypothetical protein PLEOSDRAFT_1078957 [Pleurotus ostreatus PC15]|uniref:Uncharacterized protein n=1 Tax=Pleurotus ostreatus (strain PC15) TaxID=1137138 RepID=A0A067NAN0_PLEO1|nr:hypothetical protein PLEOSDRAFT_1078957 [Pleurotus ostreatus PC15]